MFMTHTSWSLGRGYFLGESLPINEPRDTTFDHNGLVGCVGFADSVLGIAFARTMAPALSTELAAMVRDTLAPHA